MTTRESDYEVYWRSQVYLTSSLSTCLTRHTGAIIVQERHLVSSGFNGNVPGGVHCVDGGCERCADRMAEKTGKYGYVAPGAELGVCVCVHAEVNAIAQCARFGQRADGATMYCTTRPCLDCIKLIAVSGIVEVVYAENYPATYSLPPRIRLRSFGLDPS